MGYTRCTRRDVLAALGSATGAMLMGPRALAFDREPTKRHIVTLSFDDGFRRSSIRTAEIYEKYRLSACINIVASAHLPGFQPPDFPNIPRGDFVLWNELKARGHELMPHGFKHANKQNMPFAQAKDLILRSLDMFSRELRSFEPRQAIFNFPYNASTPELEQWLPTQVRAFRTAGGAQNPLPRRGQSKLTCKGFGPDNSEAFVDREINRLLARESGWLIVNTHGLDDEGWGPIRATYLDRLLERLVQIESVAILPVGKALDLADSGFGEAQKGEGDA